MINLGTKITSPLPDPTLRERGINLLKGVSKSLLYDPDRRRVLPQSMFWNDNLPQFKGGQVTSDDLEKTIRLAQGFAFSSPRPGRAVKIGGMGSGSFNMPVRPGKFITAPK